MAVESLGMELALFMFAAFIAYYFSIRFGVNVVVAELILGVAIGPSLLNLVSYTDGIRLIGELGAIFLLFVVGFSVSFKDLYTPRNFIIAFFGVVIPFFSGFLLSLFFGYSFVQGMFVGTALTATSIAISAFVLKELKVLDTSLAKAIIGAAVVDDILALLVLSLTTSIASGTFSLFSILVKVFLAVLFLVSVILLVPWVKSMVFRVESWGKKRGHQKVVLLLVLALAFAYSAAAELIGLSAIVGAFLAGVTLHGLSIDEAKEGTHYLEMVFSAMFFVSIGILLDIHKVSFNLFFWLILLVAILSKVIGCFIPALLQKMKPKEAFIVGVAMVPRGEIALVVGLIGLTSGIIDQNIYGIILAMTLITTLIAPISLSLLIRPNQTFK